VKTHETCKLKARVNYRDRVPIKPIPRAVRVFDHWFIDCAGPFFTTEGQKIKYNYIFIAIDSFSRFPVRYAMRSLTAKNVCDALLDCGSSPVVARIFRPIWVLILRRNSPRNLRNYWDVSRVLIRRTTHNLQDWLSGPWVT